LSPTAIIYVPILASENLATPLALVALACLAGWQARATASWRGTTWLAAAGAAAGLTLLTRPGTLFMAPAWVILAAYHFRRHTWSGRTVLVFVGTLALVVAPWLIRSARYGLDPFTLSTQSGLALWWGNNPAERSGGGDGVQGFVVDPALSERARNEHYRDTALEWIRANPGRYARLCRTRLLRLFGKEPDWVAVRYLVPTSANDRAMQARAHAQEGLAGVSPELVAQARAVQAQNLRVLRGLRIVAAPLVLLAFALSLARWRNFALLSMPVVADVTGLALVIFDPRYRALSDPLLLVLLAALLSDLVFKTSELGVRPRWACKLALAGAAVAASIVVHAGRLDTGWYRLPPQNCARVAVLESAPTSSLDTGLAQPAYDTCRSVSSKRVTSTKPWSVIFSAPITDRLRNDNAMNGRRSFTSSRWAASCSANNWALSVGASASLINPAMGSGTRASTAPSLITQNPPRIFTSSTAAVNMSWSLVPVTIRLCESWHTDEAIAPADSPKPRTNPRPVFPLAWCRSMTAILHRSRLGSA
jgi:hypothetical protein